MDGRITTLLTMSGVQKRAIQSEVEGVAVSSRACMHLKSCRVADLLCRAAYPQGLVHAADHCASSSLSS
jgi:hypothetical protein